MSFHMLPLMLPPPPAGCPEGKTLCGGTCIDGCCTSEGTPGQLCGETCIGGDECCTANNTPGLRCGEELCVDPAEAQCCFNGQDATVVGALCGEACYNPETNCCKFIGEGVPTVSTKCGEQCLDPTTEVRGAVLPPAALPQTAHLEHLKLLVWRTCVSTLGYPTAW